MRDKNLHPTTDRTRQLPESERTAAHRLSAVELSAVVGGKGDDDYDERGRGWGYGYGPYGYGRGSGVGIYF